ncbi:hypothetical protein RF11_11561 [Thelohanellus kitauei]|uniref:Uncharacterized protein n=1 Tax=Thelohanellus kitauei TaxID=669202 RepID=A0A0C2J6Y8_THEKT|nr:hypothetical protein RF11_11561 [Thelohanellus kitauei]
MALKHRSREVDPNSSAEEPTVVDLSGQNLMHHLRHSHNISSDLTSLTSSSPAKVAGQSAPGKHRAGRKANNYNELATSATPNNPCHNLRIYRPIWQIGNSYQTTGRRFPMAQYSIVEDATSPKDIKANSVLRSTARPLAQLQANQIWFRPLRRLDTCATAHATKVESLLVEWSASSSTFKSQGYSGWRE